VPQTVTISGGTPPYTVTGCTLVARHALAGAQLTVTPLGTTAASCAFSIGDASTPKQLTALGLAIGGSAHVTIATYHGDNLRTGWNAAETTLTPATVGADSFGVVQTVALDDQVDSQPLVVASQPIATGPHAGVHDVVYVATASNSIFAIDATNGAVLASRNLGTPVSRSSVPGQCENSGPNLGITSTPVFDAATDTLYAMAYSGTFTGPQYQLHALNAATLSDRVPPVVVSASHVLTDGTVYRFAAADSRQRPALLEANGNVYAGFGSFCDYLPSLSRGWLLGWHANSLTPLAGNELDDRGTTAPSGFYLASIWMSGAGPAADSAGNIYFATSNSDPSGTTYDGVNNIEQSVVKLAGDLSHVVDIFTPSNIALLDQRDKDFGSGGVLLLPDQPGSLPHLLFAVGKIGELYALNRDQLGGYVPAGPDRSLAEIDVGKCWCASSYFTGPDGVGRIVTGAASEVGVWALGTSPVRLTLQSLSAPLPGSQDRGVFTSVSSNGTRSGSAVIWSVSRPVDPSPALVNLYAFNAATGALIYSSTAGTWPSVGSNANIVPVVANGHVYVASYKTLTIFGLHGEAMRVPRLPRATALALAPQPGHIVSGTIVALARSGVTLRTRTGRLVSVDASRALRAGLSANLALGGTLVAHGAYGPGGRFDARAIGRAKDSPALWPADR
jgi:outer membrane protein assembly factor BamB